MDEVKVWSHNVSLTFYRLTSLSFHVNLPSHSWDTAFSKSDLEIQGQGHGWSGHSKSQSGCNILSTHIPFVPSQSAIPFLRYDFFKFWPWKSRQFVLAYDRSTFRNKIRKFRNGWRVWKSKVKVMGEVAIKSHSMGPTFYRLTSL